MVRCLVWLWFALCTMEWLNGEEGIVVYGVCTVVFVVFWYARNGTGQGGLMIIMKYGRWSVSCRGGIAAV